MIFKRLASFRGALILSAAAVGVCVYAYLIPGGMGTAGILQWTLFSSMRGDMPEYVLRFAASFIFLGALPILVFVLLGRGNGEQESLAVRMGLRAPRSVRLKKRWWTQRSFYVILLFVIVFGAGGAFNSEFSEIYPYSKTLTVDSGALSDFFLHAFSYLLFYYLPWELLFRGILILPLLSIFLDNSDVSDGMNARAMALVGIQVVPSALLHFGHPLGESIGAVLFGFLAGWLVLRYRSIWPAFVLHGAAGIALDAALTLRVNL